MDRDAALQLQAMSSSELAEFNERVVDEFLGRAVNTWHWADVTVDTSTGGTSWDSRLAGGMDTTRPIGATTRTMTSRVS